MLNDHDRVDVTNLPRQILFEENDIGEWKTAATARRLKQLNPAANLDTLNIRLPEPALLEAVSTSDAVLDCTDNFATRGLINRVCHQAGKPLISGAAIRFEGQLALFRHDLSNRPCYNCLYSEADENLESCAGQGILAPVVGTIGCMMATETIKCLLGLDSDLDGKLWMYDALAGTCKTIGIPPRDDCPVCG